MSYKDKIERILNQKRIKSDEIIELEKFLEQFESDREIDKWLKNNWDRYNHLINEEQTNKKIHVLKEALIKVLSTAAIVAGVWFGINYFDEEKEDVNQFADADVTQVEEFKEVVLQRDHQIYNLSDSVININENLVCLKGDKHNLKLNTLQRDTLKKQIWSTLKIPVGKDYYVELSDGTKVWMNACSELRFPDFFINGKRVVELNGEAYFEVKSDILNPFYVKTGNSQIVVTGTKFNVYHYSNELENAVTLVEGKVTVETNEDKFVIKPGEQFVCNNTISKIMKVDADKFTSWKDGVFEFNNLTLKEISFRIEKWYNVKFYFEKTRLEEMRFTGMVKKDRTIDYFISVLQKTTNLKFELKENSILVKNIKPI